jgi:hypothetical protein
MPHELISRRTVLRGLGAAVALPWLEAMVPLNALASTPAARSGCCAWPPADRCVH